MSKLKSIYLCRVKICDGKIKTPGLKYCAAHRRRLHTRGSLQARKPINRRVWGSRIAKTSEHKAWVSMRERCLKPSHPNFPNYGGRGIGICQSWRQFKNFLADMGKRPKGYSLERINNNRGYSPANCKWATHLEQSRNRRTSVDRKAVSSVTYLRKTGLLHREISLLTGMSLGTVQKICSGKHWSSNV